MTDHPRNVTDDMAKALAARGGLIGITWWPEYISTQFNIDLENYADRISPGWRTEGRTSATGEIIRLYGNDRLGVYESLIRSDVAMPSMREVIDHTRHLVSICGPESICYGSDHGALDFNIAGLENCSDLPLLTKALCDAGYGRDEVMCILGESLLAYMERLRS